MATKQLQSKTKPQQLLHQSQHNSKPPSSSTSSKSSSETSTMPSNNNMTTNINSNSCATSVAITQHTQDVVTIERYNSVLATLDGEVRARQHVEAQLNEARLRIQYLERQLSNTTVVYHQSQPNPLPQPQPQPQTQPQLHHPLVLVNNNNNNNNNIVNEQTKQQQQPKVEEVRPQPQPTSQSQESKQSQDKEILSHCSDISNCNKGSTSNNGNGSADGGNDTFHNNNNNNNTTNSSSQSKKLVNNNNNSGVTKKSSKSKKDRPVKIKIPGQSRYWTPEEHKLFLEALQKYGHKDLRSISNYVGTRNMTQVRTHSQKYFMRLMREAKRQNPNGNTTNVMTDSNKTLLSSSSMAEVQQQAPEPQPKAEQVTDTNIRNTSTTSNDKCVSIPNNNMNRITSFNNNNIRSSIDESDKYSVPNTCGMTLLCLVGEDTRV